jgi:hypothetical protein
MTFRFSVSVNLNVLGRAKEYVVIRSLEPLRV